jgi:hypothetical protein
LAYSESFNKLSKTPCIINEETVSPGCTLAVIIIPFLFYSSSENFVGFVIVSNSTLLPANVLQSNFLDNIYYLKESLKAKLKINNISLDY